MKNILHKVIIFAAGFLIGVTLTSYLSMLASKSFVNIIRINYQTEQHLLAIKAKKNLDMKKAIVHYRNLVEASSNPGLYCFNEKRGLWSIDLPFTVFIMGDIAKTAPASGTEKVEAINRALLADVLEKSGDIDAANSEVKKSAKLMGFNADKEVQRLKSSVNNFLLSEEELFKIESQYTYSENQGGPP